LPRAQARVAQARETRAEAARLAAHPATPAAARQTAAAKAAQAGRVVYAANRAEAMTYPCAKSARIFPSRTCHM